MSRFLIAAAIVLATASTVPAASFGVIDAVNLSGTSITSISIHGQAVPVGDLISGKLTTLTSAGADMNRVIVPDPLPLPATNSAVWDLSGDLDVTTGFQMFNSAGPQNFFFSSPLTTTASVDAVFLAHADIAPLYQFEAIDAAGIVIPAAGVLSWGGVPTPYVTQPRPLWSLPPSQFVDATASGAPGDAPVYGTPIPVGALSGVNGGVGIALNFDPGVQIHGVRLTVNSFGTFEMSEVFGVTVATPVPPPPQQTTLIVNSVSLAGDTVTGVTVNDLAIPVAGLVSAKPTNFTSAAAPNRVIVRDEAPLPTTNGEVWNLSGDKDVITGYQLHQPEEGGPQAFKFDAPITTGDTADVVLLGHLPGGNIEFNAVDAAGNIITEAGTVLWTDSLHTGDPRGLWGTPAADYVDATATGAAGDAAVIGERINVGAFSGANGGYGIALKFAPGILIHGIQITSYSGALYIDEVFGVSISHVAGDFDSDGDVDGADFVAWQTNFPKPSGATLAEGDADGDGDVDGADFVVWQTNFPYTPGPGQSPVPEPQSWVMAAMAVLGIGLRFRSVRESTGR